MIDYIYALFYIQDGKKDYFYVGRSEDIKRRMGEHRSNAKAGHTEDSREFIRNLWTVGLDFDHEILATITTDLEDYEDFWVWKLTREGYQLTNMKQGDSVRQAENSIVSCNTPEEFLRLRKENLNKPKLKFTMKRTGEGVFVDDLADMLKGKGKISEGLQAILDKRKK